MVQVARSESILHKVSTVVTVDKKLLLYDTRENPPTKKRIENISNKWFELSNVFYNVLDEPWQ